MAQFAPILVCFWLWFIAPAIINVEPLGEEMNSPITEILVKPMETYYLSIPGESRREIKIDPPAIKIAVTSQSGDTIIRCGDEQNAYSCSPGKRLELEYEVAAPITKFWGENLNTTQVRLQIEVYQTVAIENSQY